MFLEEREGARRRYQRGLVGFTKWGLGRGRGRGVVNVVVFLPFGALHVSD